MEPRARSVLSQNLKSHFEQMNCSGHDELVPDERKVELKRKLIANLEKHFSEYGSGEILLDIAESNFFSTLSQSLDITPKSRRVAEMLSEEKMETIVNAVVEYFLSLPRQYAFFFPLGEDPTGLGTVPFSSDILFCDFPQGSAAVFHETGPDFQPINHPETTHKVRTDSAYLCVQTSGLFSPNIGRGPTAKAIARAKQFLLLSRMGRYAPGPPRWGAGFKTGFVIDVELGLEKGSAIVLPDTMSRALAEWGLGWWLDPEESVSDDLRQNAEALNEVELMTLALRNDLQIAFQVLEQRESSAIKLPAGILRVCEWALDAMFSLNEPQRVFLLGMAFEALIGGGLKKQASVTERLSDRLAYLIGVSDEDREQIRIDFMKFYDLRSKVAHGDKDTLNESERKDFWRAFKLFERAMIRELDPHGAHPDADLWLWPDDEGIQVTIPILADPPPS